MEMITIEIGRDVRDEIMEFGDMGEGCSDVILRLLKIAKKRQLQDFLMNSEGFVPIEDALREAKEKWPE